MALQKTTLNINLAKGLNTKSDPFQLAPDEFLSVVNRVFNKTGLLEKRNGFGSLSPLPTTATSQVLTTFQGNLLSAGNEIDLYSSSSQTWTNKGSYEPISLSTTALVRSGTNQSQCDSAISNGLICVVFTDVQPGGTVYKYSVNDQATGVSIVSSRVIPVASGTVSQPRVFALGTHFIIVFSNLITATNHLQYVSVSTVNPSVVSSNVDISSLYTPAASVAFDGIVANNKLYLAWNGSDGGGAIRMVSLDHTLTLSGTKIFAGSSCTMMSVCADVSGVTPVIWASFYQSAGTTGYVLAVNQILATILAPTQIISSGTVLSMTSVAQSASIQVYFEVSNNYSYDGAIPSHLIKTVAVTQAGSVGSTTTLIRSVGLGSKAILLDSVAYMLVAYSSPLQPSYFLINASAKIVGKLAYSNGGGYLAVGLPSCSLDGSSISMPYLIKDLEESVNKSLSSTQSSNVYSQTGVNQASFDFSPSIVTTGEIGSDLHISGGFLWMFDGNVPVEHGFFVWPDSIEATWSATGGSIVAKPDGSTNTNAYAYQVTYEWTDNQGNVHRSAPSVPVFVTTTGALSTGSITVNIPTLRLTYKTANPVNLVVYRWSVAQQIFYQVSSISIPTQNSLSADSIAYVDTLADASIIGNNILYTTGGVIENISSPATNVMTLYKSRLFLIDAEDTNLLWFSKQVIETTPVEMSDLLTFFVAPTISASGNTGPLTALFAMDDKLILFKKDAIYYIVGIGPDNTGNNNDFSDPVFINSTVGCANQRSIVFTPMGLMFQSDKGIWMLGRDLSTNYIGAPVEKYNDQVVTSALTIPGTNQVRFTLDSGIALIYDYYFSQWGTFSPVKAVSSTIFESLQTYLDSFGNIYQETPGVYVDGSKPVLTSLQTGWFNMAGLQGFERAYFFYLLATYLSPHLLSIQIAYDYNPNPSQSVMISPDNFNPQYGSGGIYGSGSPLGGHPQLEQWRVFLDEQKIQSFQLTITEIYDDSLGVAPGAGFTLSGIDLVVSSKGNYPRVGSSNAAG